MADLKSINGLASANIKSINGLAIASVKSFNGLLIPASGWDIANANLEKYSLTTKKLNEGIKFNDDGTKIYIVCRDVAFRKLFYSNLSTAWDISSNDGIQSATSLTNGSGLYISPDGTKLYTNNLNNEKIEQYSLSTAWDLSTLSLVTSKLVNDSPSGCFFKTDGTKMYISRKNYSATKSEIEQYSLSTAWDVSTASYEKVFEISSDVLLEDLYFKDDGTKMFIAYGGTVRQYTLSTAWDVATLSYEKNVSLVSEVLSLTFKTDGTKMYIGGISGSNYGIRQYSL